MANETLINLLKLAGQMDCNSFSLINCAGLTLTAGQITLFQDPTLDDHAARKKYVDDAILAALGGGAAISAGRGIVFTAGVIDFAQASDYTANEIPFADTTTTIGFSSDFSWDDVGKVLTANGQLETVTGIQFDMASPASSAVGKLVWNDDDKTIEVQVSTDTTLQIGQEDHVYATNDTGAPIANGTPVALVGAVLGRPEIALADITPHALAEKTLGLSTEQILNGAEGFVTTRGFVRGLNTNAWNEGDLLYLSGTGTLSNTPPSPPDTVVQLGVVITKSLTDGVIYVRTEIYHGYSELNDVDISGLASGSIPWWDAGALTWTPNGELTFDGNLLSINGGTTVATAEASALSVFGSVGQLAAGDYGGILHIDGDITQPTSPQAAQGWGIYERVLWKGTNAIDVFGAASFLAQTHAAGTASVPLVGISSAMAHVSGASIASAALLSTSGVVGVGSTITGDFIECHLTGVANAGTISGSQYGIKQDNASARNDFAGECFFDNDITQVSGGGWIALINNPWGEMYQDDTGTNVVLTLQNTWYPVASGYTDSGGSGVTRTTGTGRMTPTIAGRYKVEWSISGSLSQNAQQIEFGILKNGTTIQPQTIQEEQFITSGTTYNCSGQGIVSFNGTTDYCQLAIDNNSSAGRTFTVDHITLTLTRIHE